MVSFFLHQKYMPLIPGIKPRARATASGRGTPKQQEFYCAREIRICNPALVFVMGGAVDILGSTRR